MAAVGVFGDRLVFATSDNRILTFRDMARSVSARYGTHDVVGGKPKPEFLGPALQQVTFSMDFLLELGTEPWDMLANIENMTESGYCGMLVIGGVRVGNNLWTIIKSQEKWSQISNRGILIAASVDVTIQEYV